MKTLVALLLLAGTISAQGTFRIFDNQMNDVTSGTVWLVDTNSAQMWVDFTVENIDSVTHNVTAGRIVVSQPVGASNAFTWGQIMYAPNIDTSMPATNIAPAATELFQGFYFPNNTNGTATINYCFWERTDMNNISCATVYFEHYYPSGVPTQLGIPSVAVSPNPAPVVIGVGWYNMNVATVSLYSSTGILLESRDVAGESECGFNVEMLPQGIYLISCVTAEGFVSNSTFVH